MLGGLAKSFRSRLPGWGGLVVLAIAAADVMAMEPAIPGIPLLRESPPCVQARLGRVSVSLGSKEPNQRTGMPATTVSYRRALAELARAAEAKGADAVVLRNHEAAYVAKGARRQRRPTYLLLEGAAIRLRPAAPSSCPLAVIDPAEFERRAGETERENVSIDAGVSY